MRVEEKGKPVTLAREREKNRPQRGRYQWRDEELAFIENNLDRLCFCVKCRQLDDIRIQENLDRLRDDEKYEELSLALNRAIVNQARAEVAGYLEGVKQYKEEQKSIVEKLREIGERLGVRDCDLQPAYICADCPLQR